MFTTSRSWANADSTDSRASAPAAAYNSRNAYLRTPDSRTRNSHFPGMLTPAFHRCVIRAVLLTFLFAAPAGAQNWSAAEEQLALKIASASGVRSLALEVVNRSSLNAATADDVRRNLLTQLAVQGVRFVSSNQAEENVLVSLSEDLQNYVWVAEIRQSSTTVSVVMVSLPRPAASNVAPAAATMEVRKVSLWSQEERILDVAVAMENPARMLVLDANGVTVYGLQSGRWEPGQLLPLAHKRPWPRDLRGRLSLRADKDKNLVFDVHLPGVFCKSSSSAPLTLECSESDDPWPLSSDLFSLRATYASSRNFFSGALSPGIGGQTTAPSFYSAAAIARDQTIWWLLAAADGRVHLFDGITDQVVDKLQWGSDIASLHSACGSGWQVLATGDGAGQSDTVQAFEVTGREAVGVSPAVDLNGRVTALWSESGGAGVIAVVQNLQSGRYEAFRLTLNCGS